ncbi:cytochrome C assembly family protein [Thalassotalea ganghwensis]
MELFSLSLIVSMLSYFIAAVAVVNRLFHEKGPNIIFVLSFAMIGVIAHLVSINLLLFTQSSIDFALPNVISLVSLVIAVTISALALKYKVNLLLPVTYGFAGIWQIVMLIIPHGNQIPLTTDKLALFSHVSLALIAYCVLIIATLFVFQVVYINYKLKSKNLTAVTHLPPLMQVEGQLFTLLAIGTFTLFISQLTGLMFLDNFFSKDNAHKTVLSLMALLIYSWVIWRHYKEGVRGHRVMVLTIIATFLLTLAYFGSRFVKEFLLF